MTKRSHQRSRIRRVAIPIVAALALTACGGGDDGEAGEGDDTTSGEATTAEGTTGDDAVESTDAPADTGDATDAPADTGDGGDETDAPGTTGGDETPATDATAGGTEPPAEPEGQPGGTLRYILEADVDGINPTSSQLSAPGLLMSNAVFDTLTAVTADGGWAPYLAESFESNADYTQWTMKLREGITFHDGEPLNADAVIANYEAQYANGLVGLAVKPFFPEEGGAVKVDEFTVQFNPLDADANFPSRLATQLGRVASPKWIAAALEDGTLNQQPVGTGPFMFESRSEDSVTRFVRNEDYWNGEVYLDAVEFLPVPDPATRNELLLGGEADIIQTTDAASIAQLRESDGVENLLNDSSEETFVMINSQNPPFDDIRARQALAYATPRTLYSQLIGAEQLRMADQRFIPESPYYNPDVTQVGDDPATGAELAAEYCAEKGSEQNPVTGTPTCTDGKINMEYQWSGPSTIATRTADLFIGEWDKAGFNVTRDEKPQDDHITEVATAQFNSVLWRQFGASNPSNDNVWLLCRTIGGISLNWPQVCNEDRDAVLLAATASDDEAERAELYQQAEVMINEAFTYIFLTHTMWDNAYNSNVHGVCGRTSPDGTELACTNNGETHFQTVWLDQ